MTTEQYLKNLTPPEGAADVILYTDAYNEIDDQYAIAYLIRSGDRLNVKAICATPFFNRRADSPAAGTPWTRVIWDVTAVGWLLGGKLMEQDIRPVRLPECDHHYEPPTDKQIAYVTRIRRDALMTDLFRKLLS